MRQARIDDHWRRALAREYLVRLTEVSLQGVTCIANTSVKFSGGLNAIVGSNGVGKSTFAAAVAQLLSNAAPLPGASYRERLGGSKISGTVSTPDGELHLAIEDDGTGGRRFTGDEFKGEMRWLDASLLAGQYVARILADQNFDDVLESVTPRELGPDDLAEASYLVGKAYTSLKVYEISDYDKIDRFPYFVAQSQGVEYGSEAMGRGELALLLTYWTLKDLPKNSILLLEEPETHVSPRSQDCLMNIVAKTCEKSGVWVLMTTHSPTVIRRLPQTQIKLLGRGETHSSVLGGATNVDIATILGGGVAFRGAALMEDEAAMGFLISAVEDLSPDLLRQLEFVVAGSESEITKVLKVMPSTDTWLTLIGIYDGDVRGTIDGKEFRWPFGFLPGGSAPDLLLRKWWSKRRILPTYFQRNSTKTVSA
jgi:predicted ATPase